MTSTATQPIPAPPVGGSQAAGALRVTASEWFASGARRPYDPIAKAMLPTAGGEASSQALHVFEKVVATPPVGADIQWLTMLPGYPDGSYGYAQVDWYLGAQSVPRLYIEYLGQGDSDKPKRYRHSSMERADLIQAQWRAHGIRRTMVGSSDYSSLSLVRARAARTALGRHAVVSGRSSDDLRASRAARSCDPGASGRPTASATPSAAPPRRSRELQCARVASELDRARSPRPRRP